MVFKHVFGWVWIDESLFCVCPRNNFLMIRQIHVFTIVYNCCFSHRTSILLNWPIYKTPAQKHKRRINKGIKGSDMTKNQMSFHTGKEIYIEWESPRGKSALLACYDKWNNNHHTPVKSVTLDSWNSVYYNLFCVFVCVVVVAIVSCAYFYSLFFTWARTPVLRWHDRRRELNIVQTIAASTLTSLVRMHESMLRKRHACVR